MRHVLLLVLLVGCAGGKPPTEPEPVGRPKLPCNDLEPCVKRCEGGDDVACERAGLFATLISIAKLAPLKERTIAGVRGRCEAKSARACTYLGSLMCTPVESGIDCDQRAVDMLAHACELGDGTGCILAGNVYGPQSLAKRSVKEDQKKARDFYGHGLVLLEKQCKARDLLSCQGLSNVYRGGEGLPADEVRAAQAAKAALPLAEEGCEAEDAIACFLAAGLLADGIGVVADLERAERYTRHACRMSPETCR